MDAVIGRQQLISKPVRVRTSGYGEGGGNGGGGRHSGSYGHGGRGAENGVFSGLRGNIFLLGEIGDAARTVTDILFGWQKPIVEAASEMERMRVMLRGLNKDKANRQSSRRGYAVHRGYGAKRPVCDAGADRFLR